MEEQEYQIRDRSHRQAYVLASFFLFPTALLAAVFAPHREGLQVVWALTAAVLMFWAVPSTIIAWCMPDAAEGASEPAGRGAGVRARGTAPGPS